MDGNKTLGKEEMEDLIKTLKNRFDENLHRHKKLEWNNIQEKLVANPDKLWSLNEMEKSGGEPDVIDFDEKTNEYIFCDCSPESPKGRRSVCYDREALEARKKYPPKTSALDMASEMGIELLDETQYRHLQSLESFDQKTSSWLKTPADIRKLGGAIFGDFRFGRVFIYHNGADSYYGARGFRALLKI
ncbi:DUF4256 domain-containing protein [Marivirga salinae]|uniref:DUF4256 domain-containing protein n=1 Tax=Marivirga salinarum TaxID=3059078 RepID=A0AA51NBS6_9BACT|nr:DUF4256 domain-containing protein [Marivirga sp. BDSF4-3]WMN12233.1 DUF4256 domain-containing protein [Marivirga sp. BDSF4-3]